VESASTTTRQLNEEFIQTTQPRRQKYSNGKGHKSDVQDLYESPEELTNIIGKVLISRSSVDALKRMIVWEPCAGNDAMVDVLKNHFASVIATDFFTKEEKHDFLTWQPKCFTIHTLLLMFTWICLVQSTSFLQTRFPTISSSPSPSIEPKIDSTIPYLNVSNGLAEASCTKYDQYVLIPDDDDFNEMYIYMWGAGGGDCTNIGNGGTGAYVEGALDVIPNEVLLIVVGEGGVNCGSATYGGGGSGASGDCDYTYGSSGGGRSAIQRYDSVNQTYHDIVTAGGGGAGGATILSYYGGPATSFDATTGEIQITSYQGASGITSTSCNSNGGGGGGSNSTGGCSSFCSGGSQYFGGGCDCTNNVNCAGGGGGYYGGGSGEYGGGGGSSFLSNLRNYTYSMSGESKSYTCVGQYSTYYDETQCGCGFNSPSSCSNGYVVLTFPKVLNKLTSSPTTDPSPVPTVIPSHIPSRSPTNDPSLKPSCAPTVMFTFSPTDIPTLQPLFRPSTEPTVNPSTIPSRSPTRNPSAIPSLAPILSMEPTRNPSMTPSNRPTEMTVASPPSLVMVAVLSPGILIFTLGSIILWIRSHYSQDLYLTFNSTPLTFIDFTIKCVSLTLFLLKLVAVLKSSDRSVLVLVILIISFLFPVISLAIFLLRMIRLRKLSIEDKRNMETVHLSSLLLHSFFQKIDDELRSPSQRRQDIFVYNLFIVWIVICGLNITWLKYLPWKKNPYMTCLEGYPNVFVAKTALFGDFSCNICRVAGSVLIFVFENASSGESVVMVNLFYLIVSIIQFCVTCVTCVLTIAFADVEALSIVPIQKDEVIVTVANQMLEQSGLSVDEIASASNDDSNIDFNLLQSHEGLTSIDSTDSSAHSYADLTLDIRKRQLENLGVQPLEFIPLEQLKAEIDAIITRLNNGLDYDEQRLDYLLACLDVNPDFIIEQQEIERKWREDIAEFSLECLQEMRGYISSKIFLTTLEELRDQAHYSIALCMRILQKKCLWLIRMHPHDIARLHIADIESKFNPIGQNLDVVEFTSIHASLPIEFANDVGGRKAIWRKSVEKVLKEMISKKNAGVLSKAMIRNDAYKGNLPAFAGRGSLHKIEIAKRSEDSDASNAGRLSLQRLKSMGLVQKRQSSNRNDSDCYSDFSLDSIP
jgi:hypothetical protein